MLIISLCLCGISINYFNKDNKPWSLGTQLFLIFFNCIPRPIHGVIYSILEILAHVYLQDLTRSFNMTDELPYKIFALEMLSIFFPAILEYSGLVAKPFYSVDFIKYTLLYLFNLLYTFFIEGDEMKYIVVGAQFIVIIFHFINYFRKTFKLKMVHKKAKKIYSMAGSSVEDALSYLIVEQNQLLVVSFLPKKKIQRTYNIPSSYEFAGYAAPSRTAVFFDKQNYQFKFYDVSNFQFLNSLQSEANATFIVHAKKNLLAVFSQLTTGQEGTLITVYDCTSVEQIVSVGLSHKINKQENMWIFDSFAIDIEKTSDKLIFSYEKLLCSLDIETKVNESLSSEFSTGFTLYKANDRRIVFSGKEDWAEMFDVPTNQPASLQNVYLSYSRIIPIQNLNDYYLVEPCCSKKNVYIMKGYSYDMQIVTFFELGYPNITCAIYNSDSQDLVFIDSKKNNAYRFPFYVSGGDQFIYNDFNDSIVALD